MWDVLTKKEAKYDPANIAAAVGLVVHEQQDVSEFWTLLDVAVREQLQKHTRHFTGSNEFVCEFIMS